MTQEKPWWEIERDENNVENGGNLEFDINQFNIESMFERGRRAGKLEMAEEIHRWATDTRDKIASDTNAFNKLNDETKESYWIAMNSTMKYLEEFITHLKNEEK